jgi:RND family efflux transporter MFP subunit
VKRIGLLIAMFSAALVVIALSYLRYAGAHGGENHEVPGKSSSSGVGEDPNAPRVPIEIQFLSGLRTERAKRGVLASSVGQLGHVIARPTSELIVVAPFAGRLLPPEEGFVKLGDSVRKGQILGTLRPTIGGAESAQLNLARSDAMARLASAQTRLDLAERELKRRRELKGIVAEKDVQAAEGEVTIVKSELARAKADVGSMSGGVGVQKLRSTLDGTVVAARVSPGAQVAEGTELWRIVDLAVLWADVRISEADALRGSHERATMSLAADPSVRFEGKHIATASLVDPATRTVQAIFEITNQDRRVRVGALVNVMWTAGVAVETVIIPASALLDREGQSVVVVKTGPETFEVRPVALGPRTAASIGITAGIHPGERVVVEAAMTVIMAAGG